MGPYSRTTVNGTCLEDMGIVVERVHDDPPATEADTQDVPGRDGELLTGLRLEPREITLECRVFAIDWAGFDRVKDELAALLTEDDSFELCVRTHPGEHYVCHYSSMTEGDRIGGTGIGYLELTLVADDPYRYGATGEATVPSGGSVTISVGGTEPAPVTVTATSAVRDPASTVWGVRADEGDVMHVALPLSTATSVTMDSSDRSVLVNGATAMLTLDSDWLMLEPGEHTVRMDQGTGAATLSWQERSV